MVGRLFLWEHVPFRESNCWWQRQILGLTKDFLIKLLISFEQNKFIVTQNPQAAKAAPFSCFFFMPLTFLLSKNEKKQSVLELNMN